MRKPADDERTRLLRRLCRRRFDRFRFRGNDALVARVPDSKPVPHAIEAMLAAFLPSRWYPVEGGHLVNWEHDGSEPGAGFWVEAGGWDHEHCDACNRNIAVGGTCWLTLRGTFYQLCPYCYRRLAQLHDG